MTKPRTEPACPVCGKPRVERHRPFCSPRCADADLQRWLSDVYVIPLPEGEGEERPGDGDLDEVPGQRDRGRL